MAEPDGGCVTARRPRPNRALQLGLLAAARRGVWRNRTSRGEMGRRWLAGAVLLLLAGAGLLGERAHAEPAPPEPGQARVPLLVAPPRADGRLDEWEHLPPSLLLGRAEQVLAARRTRWDGPEDLSARGWWGVHGEDLWLALAIRDDATLHDPSKAWWHGDAIEVFLDGDRFSGAPPSTHYGPNCLQLFLLPAHPTLPWGVVWRGASAHHDDADLHGVVMAHRREGDHTTTVELKFPLANLSVPKGAAGALGFALAINDADDAPSEPGTYMSWNAASELYRDPSRFTAVALPARPAEAAPHPPKPPPTPWTPWLLVVGGALCLIGLLAPRSTAWFERWSLRAKCTALALVATACLGAHFMEGAASKDARERARQTLAAHHDEANKLHAAARAVGALQPTDAEVRAREFRALLQGETIPAAPGVVRAVPVVPATAAPVALSLQRKFTLPFSKPLGPGTGYLQVRVVAPRRRTEDLGHLVWHSASGAADESTLRSPAGTARVVEVPLRAPAGGPWVRWSWRPAKTCPRATLERFVWRPQGKGARTVPLPATTQEGVPVLTAPRRATPLQVIPAGASEQIALPHAPTSDRLWVLPGAALGATPPGQAPFARCRVIYATGTPDAHVLRNRIHRGEGRRPAGVPRPAECVARVAFSWDTSDGFVAERDALPLDLDPLRRPIRLEVDNLQADRPLHVVALTLATSRRRTADPSLELILDSKQATDALRRRAPVAWRDALAPARSEEGAESVVTTLQVGSDEHATPLTLYAQVPFTTTSRMWATARWIALGVALLLALWIALDLAERTQRMSRRLTLAVLSAAAVPLLATLVVVESRGRTQLEAQEHESRLRARDVGATQIAAHTRQTGNLARQVATQLHSVQFRVPPAQWPATIRQWLQAEGVGALRIRAARGTTHVLHFGAGTRLGATRILETERTQAHVCLSPWDGALTRARVRRGNEGSWVEVTVARRIRSGDLTAPREGSLALVDPLGRLLVGAGEAPAWSAAAWRRGTAEGAPARAMGRMRTKQASLAWHRLGGQDAPTVWLVAAQAATHLRHRLSRARFPLLATGLLGLLLLALMATRVGQRVATPVTSLVEATEALRTGRFDAPLPSPTPDELGRLTGTFDAMRTALRDHVQELEALRAAHAELAEHLDDELCAARAEHTLQRHLGADAALLLRTQSIRGTATRQRWTTRNTLSDLPAPPRELVVAGPWSEALARKGPTWVDATLPGASGGPRSWYCVPLRSGEQLQGALLCAWAEGKQPDLPPERQVSALGQIAGAALQRAHLYRMALLDELTSLPGATAFEARLREDVQVAAAGGAPVSLLLVGLDNLGDVRRDDGVEAGRNLTQALAGSLRACVEDPRTLGRVGDETFAIRLATDNEEAIHALARRIVRHASQPDSSGHVAPEVSVGFALCPRDARSVEFLFDSARRARTAARLQDQHGIASARATRVEATASPQGGEGVFRSDLMLRLLDLAQRAARTDSPVLITGETGAGKEVIASVVHRGSRRAHAPFIRINCAAMPDTMIESELFGHERGAFTGAHERREGCFELADGGTLFLDEVGDLSPAAQVKLLRVLQEQRFSRVGGVRPVHVDVRLIAATHQDLEAMVAEGRFREDLYFRLHVIDLAVPPLRDRREELPFLVEHLLAKQAAKSGRDPLPLAPEAMDLLYRHSWPGNIRELNNVLQRARVLSDGVRIEAENIQIDVAPKPQPARSAPRDHLNKRQQIILTHLQEVGRCTNKVACELTGTSPRTALRDLRDLIERGLIVRDGKRRGAVYRLP